MKETLYALISLLVSFNCVRAQEDVAQYVNPFIGTSDDHGQTSPAAVVPFGMINAGPDTKPAGQSGYDYSAEEIIGFSQNRISGIGCKGTGGNLRLMPFTQMATETTRIDKRSESASAGYYSVRLQNGINVAITVGRTSAIYQFNYPKDKKSGLRLDFQASFATFKGEEHVIPNKNTVEGFVKGAGTCDHGTYTFYYHIEIDKSELTTSENEGKHYWNFETGDDEIITVRVGLSTVSVENAKDNMVMELEDKSFNQLRTSAYDAWNRELSAVMVTTGDQHLKTSFYTRLYHAFLNPANIMDYSSAYRGSDGKVYATNGDHYHGWSIWDTFRTKHPLLSIVQADRYKAIIFSLVSLFKQGKQDWATDTEPFPTVRTEHACILLLDALDKGLVERSSIELIFNEILDNTENLQEKSPDQILEKCYDYWAISELAKRLYLPDIQIQYLEKSKMYRAVWNEKFKIITEKSDVMHGDGLYEGTLWQYRWFVPHDVDWMVGALGGSEKTLSELDYFFANHLFNMGNQPDIQVPYLYYHLGEPWKTQKLVREILLEPTVNYYGTHKKWKQPYIGKIFKTTPDGYLKEMDDDAGTMSSWFVFSSMGLYPVCPGTPFYWIGAPVFDTITIQLANGKAFRIEVIRKSERDLYIQEVILNGETKSESFLSYGEIMKGGNLIVRLGEHPNIKWGSRFLGDLEEFFTSYDTRIDPIARSQAVNSPLLFTVSNDGTAAVKPGAFRREEECNVRGGIPNFLNKARKGSPLTVAFIGGSITQSNTGYRPQTAKYLQSLFPNVDFKWINAGVSGTGTDLGAFRIQEQVLRYQPDLVFIEFAVNGAYQPGMEGMIRQLNKANPQTDICLIYTIHNGQTAVYQRGGVPDNIRGLEQVAAHYRVPSIHLGMEAAWLEAQGQLVWKGDEQLSADKLLFSTDGIHPKEAGGNLYAAAIARGVAKMQEKIDVQPHVLPPPLYTDIWEHAAMYEPGDIATFDENWERLSTAELYLKQFSGWFDTVMTANKAGASCTFRFEGDLFGIFDIGGPEVGQLSVWVDDQRVDVTQREELGLRFLQVATGSDDTLINRFNQYCNDRYRGQYVLIRLVPGQHTITLKIASAKADKRTILGPKQWADITDHPEKYDDTRVYLGRILLRGKPLTNE